MNWVVAKPITHGGVSHYSYPAVSITANLNDVVRTKASKKTKGTTTARFNRVAVDAYRLHEYQYAKLFIDPVQNLLGFKFYKVMPPNFHKDHIVNVRAQRNKAGVATSITCSTTAISNEYVIPIPIAGAELLASEDNTVDVYCRYDR